ncbi:SIMPL domain-containing protein [Candidatus Wolfebacteria bacterium]|nr:SIMPL domain-containing protein [Candidatus Wolfebacteria bacterium]
MENDDVKISARGGFAESGKNMAVAIFLVFLMSVIVYSLFFGPAKKYADSLTPSRIITVSAEGKVTVSPDIANLSFSVISEGINPEKIADDNNKKISAAVEFIKSQGVDAKDVKTTNYSLNPRYEYDEDKRTSYISGYTLTQTVLVKIRDLSKVAKILGGLPPVSINQIGSISFDIDDPEKYMAEARKQAFEKAKQKAETMAAENKTKIKRVLTFSDYQSAPPYPIMMREMGVANYLNKDVILPTIESGSQEVIIRVSVTYELR